MKPVTGINFEMMKNADVRTIDRGSLVDINDVHIDRGLSRDERFVEFVRQIGNPCCYRCGKAVVKVSFSNTGATLEDRLKLYLKML